MNLHQFKEKSLFEAMKSFFHELNVPISEVTEDPANPEDIVSTYFNVTNEAHLLIDTVYFLGMVNEKAFDGDENSDSLNTIKASKEDYDGLLIFGIQLKNRANGLKPTRSQLAEITRLFNREFNYTPVTLIFKYGEQIAFANSERLKYKQEWREGEKVGKVSMLRDINIENTHAGHLRILQELKIPEKGKNAVDSFEKLYNYWQEVFSVNILNKKFYNDLSNWYFWAVKHVTFPNKPTIEQVTEQTGKPDAQKLEELINEHNAQNVIRLLTRLLFTWFIKEKKLIPEELFDLQSLQKDILNDISPYHEQGTMFAEANKDSIYYKAILQNLFFASLNCPIKPDGTDNRTRAFRGTETYGKHRGIDWMMRYKKYFKNPDAFLKLMNDTVPFLNGGLFECLDDKNQNLYIDGFSDQMTKGERLIVPDYLFFGVEENVDLSADYGVKNKGTKQAAVKGLINILKSYKFTITENTPIEEDVELDPELLGKVFENLLASYNPETKTTARKQTGSFYTPREIVNYMVDESLIAYLKNVIGDNKFDEKELDEKLHQLLSYNSENPFENDGKLTQTLILALGQAKILDPAVGSGAFPMGMLQKMVHLLQKLDPENEIWKEVQLEKAMAETQEAFGIEDKKEREEKLIEINIAFDKKVNDPDFARKLYLIENCIYGVDIQPIATQISKLRFFISLVVDQKVQAEEPNFGIRPLPNLETKFVTANTLIGIEKPDAQINMFETEVVKSLEAELKQIRHKLFNARTKETKLKYRQKDEELRYKIAEELKLIGWASESAEKLAGWDPYDQNASSSFFDPEWMFDVSKGFDLVIGNPPYGAKISKDELKKIKPFASELFSGESAILFIERSHNILTNSGSLSFIVPKAITYSSNYKNTRDYLRNGLKIIVDCGKAFEKVKLEATVFLSIKKELSTTYKSVKYILGSFIEQSIIDKKEVDNFNLFLNGIDTVEFGIGKILNSFEKFKKEIKNTRGATLQKNVSKNEEKYKAIGGKEISRHGVKPEFKGYINSKVFENNLNSLPKENSVLCQNIIAHILQPTDHIKIISCILKGDNFALLDTINQFTILNDRLSKYELWAILNSTLINWYAYRFILGKAIRTMHFDSPVSNRLPLPKRKNSKLFRMLHAIYICEDFKEITSVLDALVFNLYFPDHMQERGIDVIKYVEQDLNDVLAARDFQQLPANEKKEVIEALHTKWSDPNNEVLKRMAMFKEKSPDILKPILES